MCTLSVLARSGGGYLLAMNRDERVTRGIALPPRRDERGATAFLAPRDADAGGTWIAVDAAGRTLCLLNGDRPAPDVPGMTGAPGASVEPSVPRVTDPPEAQSRGQLLLELLGDAAPGRVELALRERLAAGALRFKPFQVVAVAPEPRSGGVQARRIDFDGRALASAACSAPFVLTSNGFDPDAVAHARRRRFERFLDEGARALAGAALRAALLELHRSHAREPPDGDLCSICMHRTEVRTVSTTLVEVAPGRVAMSYQAGQPCARAPLQELELR